MSSNKNYDDEEEEIKRKGKRKIRERGEDWNLTLDFGLT